ncbi:MAG: hypothetical protein ACRDT4_00340 [Micromonosporaceae bacterium]
MSGLGRMVKGALLVGAGGLLARTALKALRESPAAGELERINHRGATVSLAAGPALAVAASTTAAAGAGSPAIASAALVAGLGSGAVGLYDDVVGQRPDQKTAKGFKGHLSALREGRVTSGLVKIAGIGVSALVAASLVGRQRRHAADRDYAAGFSGSAAGSGAGRAGDVKAGPGSAGQVADLVIDTGLIAGTANLANLFDLRPGRALKVGLTVAGPLGSAGNTSLLSGPTGAASALLREDLDEQVMLGDSGANAWGALLGLAAANRRSRIGRLAMLAGVVGLTLASEKVSFTQVIESTPGLRDFDAWGRRTS